MAEWADFFDEQEEDIKIEEFKYLKSAIVIIVDDPKVLKYILQFLLENLNSTSQYAIYYRNESILKLGLLDVIEIEDLVAKDADSLPREFHFRDVLSVATLELNKKKNMKKKIFIICKESPVNRKEEFPALIMKSVDLFNSEIQLELFSLSAKFDLSPFKNLQFFTYEDEDVDFVSIDGDENNYEELGKILKKKKDSRLSPLKLKFYLSKDVHIAVKASKHIIEAKISAVKIDPRESKEVVSKVTYLDKFSAKELSKLDINYSYEFGGLQLEFSRDEMSQIKGWGEPCIKLLGFRSRSEIKDKFNVSVSYLVTPDDSSVRGSCSLISHLLERMRLKEVVAICSVVFRKETAIRLAALLPQISGPNEQYIPEAFNLILLPFADDIRHIQCPVAELPNQNYVQRAHEIIKHYTQNFQFTANPVIKKHYAYLTALVLEKEELDSNLDQTLPNYNLIREKCGQFIQEFNESIEKELPTTHQPEPQKRPAKNQISEVRKKAKVNLNEQEIKNAIANGELSRFTIPELTEILIKNNVKVPKGKKAVLLEAVAQLFK